MTRFLRGALLGLSFLFNGGRFSAAAESPPNVVLIYIDDLGYGDVSCNGATAVSTPNVDRLAKEGLRFTDGHSSSATCTPSRFSMLTGEYAFRQEGTGVAPGDAAAIIKPGRTTLASIFKDAGYRTCAIGKWHLGLGDRNIDWNGEIKPGPLEIGFDRCFILPATGDRVPCVYVEDHRVVGLDPRDPIQVSYGKPIGNEPTGKEHPERLTMHPSHGHDMTIVNGVSRIGYMSGGKSARWNDQTMADDLTAQAIRFIEANAKQSFFLYYAFHDIHVPRLPHKRFEGKSGMGPRGDAILEMDDAVGKVLAALDRLKLTDNTLVLFTSDNGPVVDDGYKDRAVELLGSHKPAGPLRGSKYSAFEGGTRVPFIVRWPARVKPGVSDALVCQVDFPASFAALLGQSGKLNGEESPDTVNVLPALLGESPSGREQLVEHARVLSLRQGSWKLIEAGKGDARNANTNVETGIAPQPRLFNLAEDIGEQHDVSGRHPEKVREMTAALQQIRGTKKAR